MKKYEFKTNTDTGEIDDAMLAGLRAAKAAGIPIEMKAEAKVAVELKLHDCIQKLAASNFNGDYTAARHEFERRAQADPSSNAHSLLDAYIEGVRLAIKHPSVSY